MRKIIQIFVTLSIAVLFLFSCLNLPSTGLPNPLGSLQDTAEKRMNAEVASGVGITAMNRKMMFNLMYAQVYFIGGFGPGLYEMEEGQGTVWRITSSDEDSEVIETERALLKENRDGSSWWYLGWRTVGGSEEENWEFEALMDENMQALKIKYFNADVGRIQEAVFDPPGEEGEAVEEETAPPEEAPASELEVEELSSLSRGRETIRVGAGTYKAEKLVWEITNEESGETVSYTWWVNETVPGGLVKYEYRDSEDRLAGELYSLKGGYTTRFESY